MEQVWLVAALWLGLALLSAFVSSWLRLSTAVCEIVIGALAPAALAPLLGVNALNPATPWIVFLAGAGAMLLTFLAGAELDPLLLRATWRESLLVGFAAFSVPFLGVAATAHFLLGWRPEACWLGAISLSTASVSVVYTIMLDLGFSQTGLGQGLLASSYVNNLFSAIAMGLILAPFTSRTLIFVFLSVVSFVLLPTVSARFFGRFRSRVSQPDVRYLLFLLFGLGGLSVWAGGEVVLPAYVLGMVMAGLVGKNATLIHHLRVITFGILTPFYFLRAGAQVHISTLTAAPYLFLILLAAKLLSKLAGAMPALRVFAYTPREATYCSFMISTGLGLGTIAASIGLARGLIDQTQYSHLVAAVICSAVIPTAIANTYFAPKHLMPEPRATKEPGKIRRATSIR